MERHISLRVGENIRAMRRAAGMTQAMLATAIGVCRLTVTRWETGERWPTLARLTDIATVLACDIRELVA